MKDKVNKPDAGRSKARPGIKTSPMVKHPILQLQQLAGNKAVVNLIQRHSESDMNRYQFKVIDNESGEEINHYAPTGRKEGEPTRDTSDIMDSGTGSGEDIYEG